MTISGPEMHRQLMDGYKQIQARIETLRSNLHSMDDRRDEFGDDRGNALLDLAKHYLPELTAEAVQSTWSEARDAIRQVLLRKQGRKREVEQRISEVNDQRYLQEDRLFELNTSLDQAEAEAESRSKSMEALLAADQSFVTLSRQAATAEAALERAEANLNEIEQDAARKLPAYEESALFTYLRDRGYGSDAYTQRGFTRRMDRWLANYIDFFQAKKSYEFLSETPDQMRKLIAEDRQALDVVMGEIETRRDEVAKQNGVDEALQQVQQLTRRRDEALQQLAQIREETESLQRELSEAENPRGPYYQEAIKEFRQLLETLGTEDLAARAEQTESLTDDQIVARISGAENRIDNLEQDVSRQREQIEDLQRCMNALGRMMQKFRASKFDSARSNFLPSVDVLEDLNRANDESDIDQLWNRIRRGQRWGPAMDDKIGAVGSHPVTQVVIGAMAQAAGAAMGDHARRAGRRRYESGAHRRSDRSR